ncbi:MAG TPA: hypothetical protein VK054_10720 [Beutenbergiaceae bacterium]|nr:hypothetical protein [Beutenbergiaceae bacterium]
MIPVALRSENPQLIETVRSVLAVSAIPLAVFPESSAQVSDIGLALDDAAHPNPWGAQARRYATVGLPTSAGHPGETLVVPHQAEDLLTLATAATQVLRAHVVGVVGAAGGVGASVFGAALARMGVEEGLMTCVVEGEGNPALATLLQLTYAPGLRWSDLPATGINPTQLADTLPRWEGVRVLAGDDRPSPGLAASKPVVAAVAEAHDLVVLDLQRSDATSGVTKQWCDDLIIVATPSASAVAAAAALLPHVATQPVHVVVRGPIKGGLGVAEIEETLGLSIGLYMRGERSLPAGLDRGLTPGDYRRGPLVRGARAMLDRLGVVGT